MSENPKTLDRSRPFGRCIPPDGGRHYSQDGAYFDAEGCEVDETGERVQPKPIRKPRPKPAEPEAPEALNEPAPESEGVTAPAEPAPEPVPASVEFGGAAVASNEP